MNVAARRFQVMRNTLECSVAVAICLASACTAAAPVDIGEGREPPPGLLGASLSDYAGHWDGYAEAYNWNDGSDRVRITLDANGAGTLRVGDLADLPPPNPARAYPPGSDTQYSMGSTAPPLAPGFSYSVRAALVDSQRIRFSTATSEPYREWCAMQPIYRDLESGPEPARYSCVTGFSWGVPDPNAPPVCTAFNGTDPTNPANAKLVDCGQGETCASHCLCNETTCIAWGDLDVRMDAAFREQGESLEGTLLINEARIIVRMTRM
jgi:hypothetical protein